jgi:hypothetical protein
MSIEKKNSKYGILLLTSKKNIFKLANNWAFLNNNFFIKGGSHDQSRIG